MTNLENLKRLREEWQEQTGYKRRMSMFDRVTSALLQLKIEELENRKHIALKLENGEYLLCSVTALQKAEQEALKTVKMPEISVDKLEEYNHEKSSYSTHSGITIDYKPSSEEFKNYLMSEDQIKAEDGMLIIPNGPGSTISIDMDWLYDKFFFGNQYTPSEDKAGVDWKAECRTITQQHDVDLEKIKAKNKHIDAKLKEQFELEDCLRSKDETIKKLEKRLHALGRLKTGGSMVGNMIMIDNVKIEDYVDEHDKMKDQVKSQLDEIKQISNNVDHWHNEYSKLLEAYKIRGDELSKFQCLVTELAFKNTDLQHYAQIGRVLKWYHLFWNSKHLMLNDFDSFYNEISKLYRRDPQNEAF